MPKESNVVYIGRKPPMSYVLAVITSFTKSHAREVTLKARGQAITTAVGAAEITRRRLLKELNIDNITIGTEELQQEEGGTRNVSTREITLTCAAPAKKTVEQERETTEPATLVVNFADLTEIGGIGGKRAEKLRAHGVNSVEDLARSDPTALAEKLQVSEKRVLRWVEGAQNALKQ